MSVNFSTPQSIPLEIKRYIKGSEREVEKTGKVGILRLKLEKDSATGNTVIKEQYSRVPLFVQRAMYLEETLPAMAYVYIVSPSGGILQGDRYQIDIKLVTIHLLMLPHKELPESTRWKKIMQARQSISTWRKKVILNTSRIKLYPFVILDFTKK